MHSYLRCVASSLGASIECDLMAITCFAIIEYARDIPRSSVRLKNLKEVTRAVSSILSVIALCHLTYAVAAKRGIGCASPRCLSPVFSNCRSEVTGKEKSVRQFAVRSVPSIVSLLYESPNKALPNTLPVTMKDPFLILRHAPGLQLIDCHHRCGKRFIPRFLVVGFPNQYKYHGRGPNSSKIIPQTPPSISFFLRTFAGSKTNTNCIQGNLAS